MPDRHLLILGIRGVPAEHGGFETFAEHLCRFLVERGWRVTVYCQEIGRGPVYESSWEGVRRIHIPVRGDGPLSTVLFDIKANLLSMTERGTILTLGYNTAFLALLHRLTSRYHVLNMDGIEWKRQKWNRILRAWFWLNERMSCWFGSVLVADNPGIAQHLATRVRDSKIVMIPYGASEIPKADEKFLLDYGLSPDGYAIVVARPEPENSLYEIVHAFSLKRRGFKLMMLGNYEPDQNEYHRRVMDAASDEVLFPGAVYSGEVVSALRYHARFYLHGHQVGGTNPSLVEALGAGNAVVAHDNRFNRWVADDAAVYFEDEASLARAIEEVGTDRERLSELRRRARENFEARFQWDDVLHRYEQLLTQ